MRSCYATSAFLAVLSLSVSAQSVTPGYTTTQLPHPSGTIATLSSGELLGYDGSTIERYASDGSSLGTVYTLPGMFFSGCFAVSPDETTALVGESSTGGLYAVDLATGSGLPLTSLNFNFDAVFESNETVIVSAATCGFGCGNELWRVDVTTGASTLLASVEGASGPLAIRSSGDLFYATSSAAFPAPLGSTSILEFAAADLTGNSVLTELDASLVVDGLDGAGSLEFDAARERLFLAENNFGTGSNRILGIEVASGAVETLFEGATFDFLSNLEFRALDTAVPFLGYQPSAGGRLTFDRTDFYLYDERSELTSARTETALSGPGVGGSGLVTLEVTGAPSAGFVVVAVCPLGDFVSPEVSYLIGGEPLVHLGLGLSTTIVSPAPLSADGLGAAAFTFANNAGLLDVFAIQGLVVDDALNLVGSTTASFL